jgi:sugar lactone lactonase YvrE
VGLGQTEALDGLPREYAPEVRVLTDVAARTGESPVWDERLRVLYWVDIDGRRLWRWTAQDGSVDDWSFDREVCSLGLTAGRELVLALRDGVYRFDPAHRTLQAVAIPLPGRELQRLNDGKVGPDGAFWVGAMDERPQKEPVAGLYRVDAQGRSSEVGQRTRVSNGLGFSPDGRWVYHSDSRGGAVLRYAFDPLDAKLGPAEAWVRMRDGWGRPDGAAVDVEGCYWSCGIDAGRINRFGPDGTLREVVRLPVSHPTMCCFGGEDMRTVFVTSLVPANTATPEALAGRVLYFRAEVAGLPANRFGAEQPFAQRARLAV